MKIVETKIVETKIEVVTVSNCDVMITVDKEAWQTKEDKLLSNSL